MSRDGCGNKSSTPKCWYKSGTENEASETSTNEDHVNLYPPQPVKILPIDNNLLSVRHWTERKLLIKDTIQQEWGQRMDQDEKLLQPFRYILQVPGKQIRENLAHAFNHWLQVPEDKLSVVEIVQLLHNSSLLLDDIQDNSVLRRGIPVAHSIYGVASTINAANLLFIALEKVLSLDHPEATVVYTESNCLSYTEDKPKAVFFSCIDSRMIPTRFTETDVGDMFVVRNAGNLIPHSRNYPDEITTTEPAALELGCVINNVRHIIVCGHSDCKAMNLLYALRDEDYSSKDNRRMSPLRAWMCAHASTSLDKFKFLMEDGFQKPLLFEAETPQRQFVAYIDPHNKFAIEDKLSQVNTLQQMQNIASYGFLKSRLRNNDLHIHAIWFDIYTGDIYYFSRCSKQFVEVNEETIRDLLKEVNRYYS